MRIIRPRIGFALAGAALLTAGVTSIAIAAQDPVQAPGSPCYSTCPDKIHLSIDINPVSFGSEEVTRFSVVVRSGALGVTQFPTGTVDVRFQSTTLCTIVLSRGRGSCSPSADALPGSAREYPIKAFYNGDTVFSPSRSPSEPLRVELVPSGD